MKNWLLIHFKSHGINLRSQLQYGVEDLVKSIIGGLIEKTKGTNKKSRSPRSTKLIGSVPGYHVDPWLDHKNSGQQLIENNLNNIRLNIKNCRGLLHRPI